MCISLTSVIISESVVHISDYTFARCSSLESIAILKSVISIGEDAFQECKNLTSITIPNSVKRIWEGAFYRCDRLGNIYYNGSKEQWNNISTEGPDSGYDSVLYYAVIHCIDGDIIPLKSAHSTTNNVQLSTTKATYNGKAQTPAVIVKDNQGKVIANTNYTVQYANNQNVGQASVTVTFKGSYSGTVTKTFEIVPAGTKISKVTAKKKGFTVKWKKQTEETTGYEIQYSTSSKFKGAKTAGNIKAKKTSKIISKLKAKKKYYVRIRTYKTVGGKNYYSDWSAAKNIKTKK